LLLHECRKDKQDWTHPHISPVNVDHILHHHGTNLAAAAGTAAEQHSMQRQSLSKYVVNQHTMRPLLRSTMLCAFTCILPEQ
jgi:hypothetical protein